MIISASGSTDIGSTRNRENQDTYFVRDNLYGVFDGHGRAGRNVALTVCTVFAEAVLESPFHNTFAAADEAVSLILPNIPGPSAGGTTASVLYIDPREGFCQVGHVGDSEVRYFDEEGSGVSLTADHSPSSIDEFHRIRSAPQPGKFLFAAHPSAPTSGRRPVFVESEGGTWVANPAGGNYHCTVRLDWSAYFISPYDEESLAITRAIGDFNMRQYGLTAEPTVTTAEAPAPGVTRAIVMASDGVWDVMRYEDVCAIVRKPELLGNAEAATAALMEAAKEAGNVLFGLNMDNITAVVVYLTMPAPPA